MLTDDQKKLIREEEIFRSEVRTELKEKDATKDGKIWGFLNSSFGLWLLSSVVLGSLVYSYGCFQDNRRAKQEAKERLSRLQFEITAHGRDFLNSLEPAEDYTAYSTVFLSHLQQPKHKLSDFKDATMDQLLWEYRRLSSDSTKADSAQSAIETVWTDIYSMRSEIRLSADKKRWFDNDMKLALGERFFPSINDKGK